MRVLPALLALVAVSTACGSDSPSGELEFTVELYDYHFDLESRTATSRLTVRVDEAGDCLTLPMRAGYVSATLDGEEPRSGAVEDGTVRLCGRGWDDGESFELALDITVAEETWEPTQVGFSVSLDINSNPFSYMVSWVGGCDRFGPCDTRPDRFARYRITVEHDPGTTVLCPGVLTTESGVTTCSFEAEDAPSYSTFGFAASPGWTRSELGSFGSVDVALYDQPNSVTGSILEPETHDAFMTWIESELGPYPYSGELRLAVGPTVWNGFEHPGNIMLTDDLSNSRFGGGYDDRADHTMHHEIAHMWAGNRTTLASARDFVWKEATVEYLVYLFEENVDDSVEKDSTPLAWKSFAAGAEYFPVPDNPPPLVEFYGDAYGPGPLILYRQLEALFGREPVRAAVGDILSAPGALSIEDIESALENSIGQDLSGYFATWLHGDGAPSWPRFDVNTEVADGTATVTVRQEENPHGLFGCAFAVGLYGADPEDYAEVWFDLGTDGLAEATGSVEVGFEVVESRLDPHGHALVYEASAQAAPAPRINPWLAPRYATPAR